MADEDVAPSRAEIESFLWALNKLGTPLELVEETVKEYLKDRGVSEVGTGRVMADIGTYSNYPVGKIDGEDS